MKACIVSDTTALIVLVKTGRLALLGQLFETVFIPAAVRDEIAHKNDGVAQSAQLAPFIQTAPVQPAALLTTLQIVLDAGESEAIALALEKRLPLLIDEKKGRQIAQAKGVAVIDLLGVLLLAVRQNALTAAEARQAFEGAAACGYRVSKQLADSFLAQLGAMEK